MDDLLQADHLEKLLERMAGFVQEMSDAKGNRRAEIEVYRRFVQVELAVKAVRAEQDAAFESMRNVTNVRNDEDRVARLLRAFEFGAKLQDIVWNEMRDTDAANAITVKLSEIRAALDGIGDGMRTALARFLDHVHPGVRASAAAFLIDTMPDRAVPVLRAIQVSTDGKNAALTATFSLMRYKNGDVPS
jgi:hypothetical protein